MGRAAHEARAEHDVRLAVEDRSEELRIFGRVVLQVRVLDDHGVARRGGEPGAERGALAAVDVVVQSHK